MRKPISNKIIELYPPTDDDKNIAKFIKKIREYLNISIAQIAQKTDLPEEQYIKREDGKKAFTASEILAIAIAFKVPVQTLYIACEYEITDLPGCIFYARCEAELTTILHSSKTQEDAARFIKDIKKNITSAVFP